MTPQERGKIGVLLFHDNAVMARTLRDHFKKAGFKVTFAQDMYDVPKAVKELDVPVGVVIADFNQHEEQSLHGSYKAMQAGIQDLDNISNSRYRQNGVGFAKAIKEGRFAKEFAKKPYFYLWSANVSDKYGSFEDTGIDDALPANASAEMIIPFIEKGIKQYQNQLSR